MPIYEYECRRCGHEFETIQKFSDKALRKCPDCGRLSLRKKLSAAAFHLKGTGWYATDFRDKGKKKPAAKSGDGEEKKSETKSDSKPDTETSTKSSSSTEKKAAAG